MSEHGQRTTLRGPLSEAKRKEQETRARLGPRLGAPKSGGHRVTLEPRQAQRTGVPRGVGAHGPDNPNHP